MSVESAIAVTVMVLGIVGLFGYIGWSVAAIQGIADNVKLLLDILTEDADETED